MSIAKRRLSPQASRLAALDAAQQLLIEAGPQAVTLKAVAAKIGRTHANLLHHFGSASGLQRALAEVLATNITAQIAEAVHRTRRGETDPREIVDLTFDAFDSQGGGALASWMILSGNEDALDPILTAIHRLVDDVADQGHDDALLHQDTLSLVLTALGDALLGEAMAKALGLARGTAREIAARQLRQSLALRVRDC